ncbi:MAG: hypothetical protein RIT27_1559 [Pseudomonadota bacterium]|jgi:ferrous iron transport protein A
MLNVNLRDLKSYLIQHRQATITDLSYHFKKPATLISSMLQHWVQKGQVERIELSACQKGCCQGGRDTEIYRWITPEITKIPFINCRLKNCKELCLGHLKVGENGKVIGFNEAEKNYRRKLLAMGLTPGTHFSITRYAPLGDPVEIKVRGFSLSLRRTEADALLVERVS